ncbi:MAG: CpaF family protein [Ardenticatenaceae bacterium]|nr:CpaF family protein [Ardenticatenaceae bacterium]
MNAEKVMKALSPLKPYMDDPNVSEILIDGYDKIYIEEMGRFKDLPTPFENEAQLMDFINNVAAALDRQPDESKFMIDSRLPDNSRINIVLPPVAILGPSLVIRRFSVRSFTFEDLIHFGSLNEALVEFFRACVLGRLNIVMAGGTGSGKTAVLNLLTGLIPPNERIVTVENAAELNPPGTHKRVIRLESQPGDAGGKGVVTMRDLVQNALRMRPDRLIIGEVRGGEAIDVIQAMNTGHDGSMFAIHAGNPRDVLARLEGMVAMAMPSLPLLQVRRQMAAAFDLIIYQEWLRDGSRKVMRVSEVVGMQGDEVLLQDIFRFQETGMENGRIQGQFLPTGTIPTFLKKIHASGVAVPMSLFTPQ